MTELATIPGPHGTQLLPATAATAQARADRIRLGIVHFAQLLKDIADAYHQRDWSVLGYATWDAYVAGEFNGDRIQLPRDLRERAVFELREAGLSTRAIGSALGVGVGTVHRDLAGVPTGTPDTPVTGTDGKRYAATQPERTPEPATVPPPADTPAEPDLRQRCESCNNVMTADDLSEEPPAVDTGWGYRRCAACDPDGDHFAPEGEPCRLCPKDPAKRAEAVAEVAPEYVQIVQPAHSRAPAGAGTQQTPEVPAADPPSLPPGGSAPLPQPTPEAVERHNRERDELTSREVASKNLARSVWLLAQAASVTDAADVLIAEWQPSQDIYPEPTTAERMRRAADYLYALAERWPQ